MSADEPADADPTAHVVVLSGDLAQDDGPAFANNTDNAYTVVTALACDAAMLLDGVTLTAGNADGDALDAQGAGGGLFADASSLTLTDVTLTANAASYGGGLVLVNGSTVTLAASTVTANAATLGGGLYADGLSTGVQTLTVTGTTFSSNTATIQGSAVRTDSPLLITGSNSIIR